MIWGQIAVQALPRNLRVGFIQQLRRTHSTENGPDERESGSGGPEPATYCIPEARPRTRFRSPALHPHASGQRSLWSGARDVSKSSSACHQSSATAHAVLLPSVGREAGSAPGGRGWPRSPAQASDQRVSNPATLQRRRTEVPEAAAGSSVRAEACQSQLSRITSMSNSSPADCWMTR